MSLKLPICNYAGQHKELQAGDIVSRSSALLDLSSCYTVINDDVADTLISATAEPGSPQYTRTIASGDIPSNANVTDYFVLIAIGGKNTDSSTRTINYRVTINGANLGTSSSRSAATATPFWWMMGRYIGTPIAAGDVLGVKLWASVTNVVDYRYAVIYIMPRTISLGNRKVGVWMGTTFSPAESISGVSNAQQSAGTSCGLVDTATVQSTPLATLGSFAAAIDPQSISTLNAWTNTNAIASNSVAAATLPGVQNFPKHFRILG